MHSKKLTCPNNSHKKSIFPFLIPLFSIFLLSIVNICFADEVTIGAGTTTGQHLPTEAYYNYSYTQQIFLQSEIATEGRIDSIYFYWNNTAARSRTVAVYLGHTSKSVFTSTTDWVTSGLTQVYSGTYSLTSSAGWHKIVLSTPFYYNNSDNLLVAFDDNTGSYGSDADEFRCSYTGASVFRSLHYYNDATNPDPATPPTATAGYAYRSNLRIAINPDVIGIGTGTDQTTPLPTEVLYDYSYTQQIYLQSEIDAGEAVNIDSLYFYWDGGNTENRTITLYMTNTSKSSFSATSDYVASSSLTQVFSGTYALTSTAGWHKIVLDDPFYYNNSDNLLIAFDDNTGSYVSANDFYCSSIGTYMSIYFYQDNTNILPSSPSATYSGRPLYRANLMLMTSPGTALTAPVAGAGTCLSFDGTTDYVSISSYAISGSAWTLEFWIKPNSMGDNDRIFLQGTGAYGSRQLVAAWDDADDQIEFMTSTTGTSGLADVTSSTITDDNSTWTHVAWTSANNVYVNGVSSTGSINGAKNWGIAGTMYIGCRDGTLNYLNGSLDNVRLWSDVRSQAEIQEYMYKTLDTTSSDANNLILDFRFDEPSGATAIDYTDAPTNGTITGATRATSEAWKNRSTDDDTPITFFAGYDPNEDAVTLSQTVAPSNGALLFDHTNVEITYVPDKNASGADAFTLQISDGTETDTYQMSITSTNNNISPVAGSGNCLSFDGVDEYILLPDGDMVSSTWTLEFWVKPNSPGDHERIFLLGADATSTRQVMALWYSDHLEFYQSGSGSAGTPQVASGTIIDDNSTWTHVAWTYNGSSHTVYVNGQSSSGTVGGGSCGISGSSYIGTWNAQSDKCWTGSLDEIRLWDDARTITEIQDNRYTALVGNEANLVGYWRFDESAGDFAYDYAGADDHGYLKNMEDGDFVNDNTWKYRSMQTSATLSHSAGYDPDGGGLPSDITEVTGPSAGTLTFDQVNDECDYTASATPGTITYTYRVSDGTATDDYDMEIEVTGSEDYSTWSYSQNFYLNTTVTGADVDNDVYNFPVLIRLDTTNFDFSEPLSTGYDIRFSKSDITQHLSFERERWTISESDSLAEFWVRVDTVQGDDNTQYIKMFWGKAGASDASSSDDVFKTDANYDFNGVWHLTDGGPCADATSNGNNFTNTGSTDGASLIGEGQDFDGDSDYLNKTDAASLDLTDEITMSAWVNLDNAANDQKILGKVDGGFDDGYLLGVESNAIKAEFRDNLGSNKTLTGGTISSLQWIHLAVTRKTSGNIIGYVNGWPIDTVTASSNNMGTNTNDLVAGSAPWGPTSLEVTGYLDEIRLSSAQRSADWIRLSYENQRLAQTLVHDEVYSNWTYNSNWTINTSSSGGNVSGDVTDFPLLLRFDATNFTFTDAETNGQDLRFARTIGSGEKHLYYEIERWDNGSEVGEVWVRVDSIYGNNATQYIKMYWGNSGVRNRSRGTHVFDVSEGSSGTWHLSESANEDANNYKDITLNANHGQGTSTDTDIDGYIGRSQDFDGSLDYITIPYSAALTQTTFTTSCWCRVDGGASAYRAPIGNRGSSAFYGYNFYAADDNTWHYWIGDGSAWDTWNGVAAVTQGEWVYLAITYNGTKAVYYLDGDSVSYDNLTYAPNTSEVFKIGEMSSGSYNFNGPIDEVRLNNSARSSDWIKLCYETQRTDQITVTSEEVELLPITVNFGAKAARGNDTCEIYTDDWKIIFDEDIGGGIKWLSDESQGAGSNQLQDDKNLFYIRTDNTGAHEVTGTLTLKESNSLFCNLLQEFAINDREWDVEYNIYGNGRMFVRVSFEALNSYNPVGGLKFMVRSDVTNRGYYTETGDGSEDQCNYLLHSDQASSRFDILLALYEDWSQADDYTAADANDWFGIEDNDWGIEAGKKQVWEFMIDFAHKKWNDTSGVGKVVDDYRDENDRDSLVFTKGNYRMEKSWQHRMVGHWPFDEASSGSANADTAFDYSPATHYGVITGGDWADGKWNNGLDLDGASDLVTLTTPETFDEPLTFTIMAWIKKDGTTETDDMIFGKYNHTAGEGYRLYSHDDTLRMDLYSHADTGTSALGTGWRHVAVTFDKYQGWLKLFVDGKVDALKQIMPTVKVSTIDATIGNSFAGIIDDVRFYNEAISEETVRAIALNGYRVNQGQYMLRADNNNTIHIQIDGSSAEPEYFPIFQIANYWQTHTPYAVYYDGSRMATTSDYITSLDDDDNILYLGFNKKVTETDLHIYIDDTDSSGAFMTGPTKKMYWGTDGDHFYVKNLSGTTFGSSGSNEFYLYWKMDLTAHDGEIDQFKSSELDPGEAISSADNLVSSAATHIMTHRRGCYSSVWYYSRTWEDAIATSTYTVVESSDVRVRLKLNKRDIEPSGGGIFFDHILFYTIYPTGQIFVYDSIKNNDMDTHVERYYWLNKYDAGVSSYIDEPNFRGGVYGGSSVHDMAGALLCSRDVNGVKRFYTGLADTVAFITSASSYTGIMLDGTDDHTTSEDPYVFAFYTDIQHNNMTSAYMDSVCESVQDIKALDFSSGGIGSAVTNTEGDINTDGFNEGEGAYIVQASDNTVNFKLEADGSADDCRFYPAFRITNYYAKSKPKYVQLYDASDTMTLIEDYGYNIYLNTTDDELILQIDSVLCADIKIYISYDDELAVELSDFYAKAGDGNDTLFWKTESEEDNLGFFLYRRIKLEFLDSLTGVIDSVADSLLDNAGVMLKQGKIGYADTAWVSLTKDIIPSQYKPGDIPGIPREYKKIDWAVENDILYEYKLVAIDKNRIEEEFGPIQVIPQIILPMKFFLFHNFPNPARFYTNFRFDLPQKSKVSLYIYNLQGRLIYRILKGNRYMKPGFYHLRWNCKDQQGRKIASGPYIYRFVARGANKKKYVKNRMMILIK